MGDALRLRDHERVSLIQIAMKLLAPGTAFCAVALVAATASAATRPTILPPEGERASYLWTVSRHSPVGELEASAAVVLRGRDVPGTMQVAVTVDGDDQTYIAKSLADGSLDFVATRHESMVPELVRLDQVARLAGGASANAKPGDTFKLDFLEPVPGGTIDVTVLAHVVSVDGGTMTVQADGEALGSIELPAPAPTPGLPAGPGGRPGGPSSLVTDIDDGSPKKDTSLDVKLRLHLEATFAGGLMVEAKGTQIASPLKGRDESIETDWSFTKS